MDGDIGYYGIIGLGFVGVGFRACLVGIGLSSMLHPIECTTILGSTQLSARLSQF